VITMEQYQQQRQWDNDDGRGKERQPSAKRQAGGAGSVLRRLQSQRLNVGLVGVRVCVGVAEPKFARLVAPLQRRLQPSHHERGAVPFVSAQNHWSLLERAAELDVVPAAVEYGLGQYTLGPHFNTPPDMHGFHFRIGRYCHIPIRP